LGDVQSSGHILTRLHLRDETGRKLGMDGMTDVVKPLDVTNMMRRDNVAIISESL
jgi:hypothetical protein